MKKQDLLTVAALAAGVLLLKKQGSVSGVGAAKGWDVARVVDTRFRNATSNGNPSYYVTLESPTGTRWEAYTAPNTGLAYEITNRNFRTDWHVFWYTTGKRGVALQDATPYNGGM